MLKTFYIASTILLFCNLSLYAQAKQAVAPDCSMFAIEGIGSHDFELPLVVPNSSIKISRDKGQTTDQKTIIFKSVTPSCSQLTGLTITLGNNEILSYPNLVLQCSENTLGNHQISGSLKLSEELYLKIYKFDVTEFKLGYIQVPVVYQTPESLPFTVHCIFTAK
ncbi:MAG TPA: hypothetical protein VFQ50_03610 [Flavobacterium sp.]|jgi:hypothetical protein|nr:hypothetical protein [Flavobacterium sp.]